MGPPPATAATAPALTTPASVLHSPNMYEPYPRAARGLRRARGPFLLAWLLALGAAAGFGQSEEPRPPAETPVQPTRTLGDQVLQISVGPFVPLFFQSLDGVAPTGLTLGGAGSLQWNAYVNRQLRIGVEVAGIFAFSQRKNTLFMVPITAKGAYVLSAYPFEFPIYLGVGMNIVKYIDDLHVDPIIKPGFGVFWQFDVTWSFGLNVQYWWAPLISSREDTRFGNFLEISLSALYGF
jgi:hypothetical protein